MPPSQRKDAAMTTNASAPKVAPDDDDLVFPALTDERAKEIALQLAEMTGFDQDVFALVVELVLGVAPVKDATANLGRFDVAYTFAGELFYLTPGFTSCAHAYMREIFNTSKGDDQ